MMHSGCSSDPVPLRSEKTQNCLAWSKTGCAIDLGTKVDGIKRAETAGGARGAAGHHRGEREEF